MEDSAVPRQVVVGQRVADGKIIRSRAMRRDMTPEEAILWEQLRRNAMGGLKFRRQQIIDGFIADFYCHSAALVIELDGSHHEAEYDAQRDSVIRHRGLQILRFTNEAVRTDLAGVLRKIANAAGLFEEATKDER